ncbi:MAG: enoyl-CoA hydratase/isomerase family protein, partial [Chloroflexi bacterium]|nr:enoyl-CoA hydratase/isomerase family protein [Chloroflexota bacterium]
MARIDLKLVDRVALVTMDEGDNKLNLQFCDDMLAVIDRVEKETAALTLVVRSGHPHIWSNGFDVDWIKAMQDAGDREAVTRFLTRGLELRMRLLTLPLITVALLNGHVFGGAAVLSCCFDFRFMRSDRGFFCIPAVDRDFPILPGTGALLGSVLPAHVVRELVLTGRRFTGHQSAEHHIVAGVYHHEELE